MAAKTGWLLFGETDVMVPRSLVLKIVPWSGPPACHIGIHGDILRIRGVSYWKNVGMNADMAGQRPGQRPSPPSARKRRNGVGR